MNRTRLFNIALGLPCLFALACTGGSEGESGDADAGPNPGQPDAAPGSADADTTPDAEPPVDPNKDDDGDGYVYADDCGRRQ